MGYLDVVYDGKIEGFEFTFIDETQNPPALADPAEVAFCYVTDQPGFEQVTWIYGTNPEITKVAIGTYRAYVDTTGMAPAGGRAFLTIEPFGSADGEGTLQTNEPATVLVLANPVTNPFEG